MQAKQDTHLGVPSEDIVLLSGDSVVFDPGPTSILGPGDFPNALYFTTRVFPDGTEVEDYRVPDGKVLVITDINWDYKGTIADHLFCLPFNISPTDPTGTPPTITGSHPYLYQSCFQVDGDRVGGASG